MTDKHLICDFCDNPIKGSVNIMWCDECGDSHNMCDHCFKEGEFEDSNEPMNSLRNKERYR